jgi:hypothetical protein
VLRHIVEGEPGIFPEPVARIMRGIGGLFQRKPKAEADQPAPETPAPADPPDPDDQSGAAR